MNDLQIALGIAIRKLREKTGLSQEKFAAKAGIDRTYQTSVENGRRNVSLLTLDRISRALGVNTGELLIAAEQERKTRPKSTKAGL